MWMIDLIQKCKSNKPNWSTASNKTHRALLKQYHNLILNNNLLYLTSEDRFGMKFSKFVLPHYSLLSIFDLIHAKGYGGHLGRRKTYRKISERFYRRIYFILLISY
jgi:hypothetical protein